MRPTGLKSKRTESPRNATPITTPTKLAWAKIRTATPIAAASNQSDLIGAFFHRLTPLAPVYAFREDPRRAECSRRTSAPCNRYLPTRGLCPRSRRGRSPRSPGQPNARRSSPWPVQLCTHARPHRITTAPSLVADCPKHGLMAVTERRFERPPIIPDTRCTYCPDLMLLQRELVIDGDDERTAYRAVGAGRPGTQPLPGA